MLAFVISWKLESEIFFTVVSNVTGFWEKVRWLTINIINTIDVIERNNNLPILTFRYKKVKPNKTVKAEINNIISFLLNNIVIKKSNTETINTFIYTLGRPTTYKTKKKILMKRQKDIVIYGADIQGSY